MKIAIVDDMIDFANYTKDKVTNFYSLQPYNEAVNVEIYQSGTTFLSTKENFDFIILDVEMPDMDGFEVAKRYQLEHSNSIIIFLSTHDELGRMGYRVNAFRYIDKNNMDNEFPEALSSVWELVHKNHFITVHLVDDANRMFMTNDIYHLQSEKHHVTIYTKFGNFTTNMPMQDLEKMLIGYGFYRSHKRCIVNLEHIKNVERDMIYLQNNTTCFVSTRNYRDLKKAVFQYKFKYAYR